MKKHNPQPIYIVGVGRSGTSLIQSILGSHPEVGAIPETSFLRRYVFSKKIPWDKINSDQKILRIASLKRALGKAEQTRSGIVKAFKSSAYQGGKKYVIDKDPRLVEFLPLLELVAPKHKVVIITRDPRDVILSKRKAQWSQNRSLLSYLVAFYVQNHDSNLASESRNVYVISYEKLLIDPKKELTGLCNFLSLDFSHSMLEFQKTSRALVSNDEISWKKETLLPLLTDNYEKWRGEVTNLDAFLSVKLSLCAWPELSYDDTSDLTILDKALASILYHLTILISRIYLIRRKILYKSITDNFM